MKLTSKKVQRDVRDLLLESELAKAIDGGVYHAGTRPRDSRAEDAVVIFTGGVPDQIDEGVVTLNVYVPDILPYGEDNGVQVEDLQRVEEIEELAREFVRSLSAGRSCYRFRLLQTIHSVAEPSINQHFVVVKLAYRYYDGVEE